MASTAALLAAVAWPIATQGQTVASPPTTPPTSASSAAVPHGAAKIQIALLLDTSSSMDGLIDQARSQLWGVVNALDSASFQGATPRLEIAVYEYGNDRLAAHDGFIRKVVPFSSELDRVSEGLFGLTTAGGDEYAGQVVHTAAHDLDWESGDHVLRVLYIAGNESFDQGSVDFRTAVRDARERGIVVNTVNCVGRGGADTGWETAAELGGGKALRIDQDQRFEYVAAPQDDEIQRLGVALNETYVGYGRQGASSVANQARQDTNSVSVGQASTVSRALSKASGYYENPSWDLVDALDQGTVELPELDRSTLSRDLRELSDDALQAHVADQKKERTRIKARLAQLSEERQAHLDGRAEDDGVRLETVIMDALIEQAAARGFKL